MYPNHQGFPEIVTLELTQPQRDFLDKHKICISDAYLGMLRVYRNNLVIWQSNSALDVAFSLSPNMGGANFSRWLDEQEKALRAQCHAWLNKAMALSPADLEKLFSNNYHLFTAP